jgi:type II secretion system protein I
MPPRPPVSHAFSPLAAFRRAARHRLGGFTLIELLASLLLMAIIIPVAMQGMSVATRAGVMGQRKTSAMRVADRLLNEAILTGMTAQASSGTLVEGETSYPWTMETTSWSQDAMLEVTVRVTFTVQGNDYTVSASTLVDPTAPLATAIPEALE